MPSKMRGPCEPMTGRGGIENGAASEGDGVVDLEARVHVVHEGGKPPSLHNGIFKENKAW